MYTSFSFILYLYYIIFFYKSQITLFYLRTFQFPFSLGLALALKCLQKSGRMIILSLLYCHFIFFIIIISYFFIKVKCPVKKSFFNIISYFLYKVKCGLSGFNQIVSHMLVARINNLGLSTFPVFDPALPYPAGFQQLSTAYGGI